MCRFCLFSETITGAPIACHIQNHPTNFHVNIGLVRWLILLLLCVAPIMRASAQDGRYWRTIEPDSILRLIPQAPDTTRLRLQEMLMHHYLDVNLPYNNDTLGRFYALQNMFLAKQICAYAYYARAGAELSIFYTSARNIVKAANYAYEVLPYVEKYYTPEEQASFQHHCIAAIYYQVGKFKEVISTDTLALKLLKVGTSSKIEREIASIHGNIGNAYDNLNQNDSARKYFEIALHEFEALGYDAGKAYILVNIGELQLKVKQYDAALATLKKAYALAKDLNEVGIMTDAQSNIAEVYLTLKAYKKAKQEADASLAVAAKTKYLGDILDALNVLYKAYAKLNQYDSAFTYFKHYNYYRDSLKADVHARELIEVQAQLTHQQKESELKTVERTGNLRLALVLGLAFSIILIGVLVFFYYRLQMRKLMNEQLVKSKAELEKAFDELQSARNQLLLSEKLALLGQLTAGVSHEINTPLGVIRTSAESTQKILPKLLNGLSVAINTLPAPDVARLANLLAGLDIKPKARTTKEERQLKAHVLKQLEDNKIGDAESLAQRLIIAGLTDQLEALLPFLKTHYSFQILEILTYAGQLGMSVSNIKTASERTHNLVRAMRDYTHTSQTEEKTNVSVLESVNTILTLYAYDIRRQATLITHFDSNPIVFANPDRLGQIWINIINNALQALEEKEFETEAPTLEITIHEIEAMATVTITDNGSGIPEEVIHNIFDPFFTTKPRGKGTGMGLSLCKEIIESYNGILHVTSKNGETRFTIAIPVVK